MGSLVNRIEDEVLDHILKTGAYSPPATVYLALFTADPGDAGSVSNEATYTGYARKSISFGAAASRSIAQNAQVDFDQCTGGSETITHWGLMESGTKTTDDMMAYGAFTTGKGVSAGYTPYVESAEVVVTFSAGAVATGYADDILDWLFRAQSLSQPTNIYIALFSTACSDSTPGTELSGSGYARIQCDAWDASSGGASENTNTVMSAAATGDWSQAIYAALYDAVSGGTYMIYINCNDLTVLNGEKARFLAGEFDVTLD
jgi:hypothetical protein